MSRIFTRAWKSVYRRLGKTMILFLVMMLLGSLVSGAIVISQAVATTEINLLRRIPPVATINNDNDAIAEHTSNYGWTGFEEQLTAELFEKIAQLPYVRTFDYAFSGYRFFSSELVFPTDVTPYLNIPWLVEELAAEHLKVGLGSLRGQGYDLEQFTLKGIHNPDVLDIEGGVIDLLVGRRFTATEIQQGAPVAMISNAFAQVNNLNLGDSFVLDINIYETYDWFTGNFIGYFESDAPLVVSESVELEVIGIFEPTMLMDEDTNNVNFNNHIDMNRRIYVPMPVAKSSHQLLIDFIYDNYPELLWSFENFFYDDLFFQLYDSLYLSAFNEAATSLLPDLRMITDLTYEFSAMTNSMNGMQEMVNNLLIGVTLASFMVLGLLILLFLHDRRQEIGIYLALGESKIFVVTQVLVEIVLISFVALSISLFVGHLFSELLTQNMIQNEIINNPHVFINQDMILENDFNRMGFGVHMSAEEMAEAFDVSLDATTVLLFYGAGLIMTAISGIAPTLYITFLRPKKILLQGKVG